MLPRELTVVYDSGNFLGFLGVVPYLSVPGQAHPKMTSEFESALPAKTSAPGRAWRPGSASAV